MLKDRPIIRSLPDVEEAVALLKCLPGNGKSITLEALQAQRDLERELACRELDALAKLYKQQDDRRRKLWGNKFPRVLGAEPLTNGKSSNPVKKSTRTSKKAKK